MVLRFAHQEQPGPIPELEPDFGTLSQPEPVMEQQLQLKI